MKKTNELYLGLEDLGKSIFIDSIAFGGYNGFGVSAEIYVDIRDDELCKEFNIPIADVAIDFYLETFNDNGVDGVLFTCAKDVFSGDSTYANDSYDDRYTLFTFSEDVEDALPNIHLNDDLVHVFEAFATVCFFNKLGFDPTDIYNVSEDRSALSKEEDKIYVRQYLVQNNLEILKKEPIKIKGKDIDYPR